MQRYTLEFLTLLNYACQAGCYYVLYRYLEDWFTILLGDLD